MALSPVLRGLVLAFSIVASLTARAQEPQRGGVLTAIHWPEPTILN